MKHNFFKALICASVVAILSIGSANADTIYADSGLYNSTLLSVTNGQEVGNEITVAGSALTSFAFEYYATTALAANVGVDVRFYDNNGTPENGFPTPGTLFFDSGWYYNTIGGIPTGANNLNYSTGDFAAGEMNGWGPSFPLPSDFTFTITWTNVTPGEIEMPLADNTPGASTGYYWLNDGGSWTLMNNVANANFLVNFQGTVPEPSAFGLAALGGVLLMGINKLRRKG